MGDSCPFISDIFIAGDDITEIKRIKLLILFTEYICCQAASLLNIIMRPSLEFRKHRLAEYSGPYLFYKSVYEIFLHLRRFFLTKKIVQQKAFVDGRGDFGDEDRIIACALGLCMPCVIRVHRVPQLVYQSKDVLQSALKIEKYIRICVICAEAVGAARLAGVLIYIDPALLYAARDYIDIIASHRGERLFYHIDGVIKWNLKTGDFGERGVDVVHHELIKSERLFS